MKKVAIREFEASRYLDSEEMIAEFLAACLEDPTRMSFLAHLEKWQKRVESRNWQKKPA